MSETFDIVVVGAGAAGIAAAVSAAREGCATLLMDSRGAAGGTGGFSGLTTLCGLFDEKGEWLNDGFAREFAEKLAETAPLRMGRVWALPYRPEKFREVTAEFIKSTPHLQTRWNTVMANATVNNSHIETLNGIRVGAVIDCSGTAEVARAIGAECLETDETTQAPAVLFPLHNVRCDFNSPVSMAQALLPLARAGLPPLSFQPSRDANTVTVKFTGRPEQVAEVINVLRKEARGFEQCETTLKEFTTAHRAGRMIIGQYVLSGTDVLTGRKFPDAAARGAWPIEKWDAKGRTTLSYLPENVYYEIPARSLRAAGTDNLFMGGKVISADVDGIASARVMGCCLATGAAAGRLAAKSLEALKET